MLCLNAIFSYLNVISRFKSGKIRSNHKVIPVVSGIVEKIRERGFFVPRARVVNSKIHFFAAEKFVKKICELSSCNLYWVSPEVGRLVFVLCFHQLQPY